jgi:hypothetical protein
LSASLADPHAHTASPRHLHIPRLLHARQVSLTEKVWVCTETGKVCFNEIQMDLHKKRVPEAQTFEEKTVADLKAWQAERAAAATADGDAEMETEEDAILRAAGKKPKGKGGEAAAASAPVVTKESVDQLVEMVRREHGFT